MAVRVSRNGVVAVSVNRHSQQLYTVSANFNGRANYLEIAAITNSNPAGLRTTHIDMTSELIEPLSYPLLFTKGDHGSDEKNAVKVGTGTTSGV